MYFLALRRIGLIEINEVIIYIHVCACEDKMRHISWADDKSLEL